MSNQQMQALRLTCYLMAGLSIILLVMALKSLIICLVMALMLAAAMTPLAERLEKKKIPRLATVAGIYLMVVLLYIVLAAALFPAIIEQGKLLIQNIPDDIDKLTTLYEQALAFIGDNASFVKISPADSKDLVMKALNRGLDWGSEFFSLILNGTFIIFIAAYFVHEAKNLWKEVFRWIPPAHHDRASALLKPLQDRLGGYVRGQLLVAAAVAGIFLLGLSLLKVKYALVLGALAGLLNIVPFIGSFAAFVFMVMVAFNQSIFLGIAVIVLFFVEQSVESNFIVPVLLGKQVELHPLAVLIAMIIGATLAGVAGAIVAIPLVSIAIYLGEEFYVKKIRNEHATVVSENQATEIMPPG